MNVYHDFIHAMTEDEWEFFALDFLDSLGYQIERRASRGPDGGRDGIVSHNGKNYLVSCKHFSKKAVGVDDEKSILDRMGQHNTDGFIGFYSTLLSTGLEERFNALRQRGHDFIVYDANSISNYLPHISSNILQKYGIPKQISYPLNVPESDYRPLCCLGCNSDMLQRNMIRVSMALICLNDNDELEYLYGCKRCVGEIPDSGWVDLYQALHPEQLNGWITYVDAFLEEHKPSKDFYRLRSEFEGRIQQRMFPSNWGQWLA